MEHVYQWKYFYIPGGELYVERPHGLGAHPALVLVRVRLTEHHVAGYWTDAGGTLTDVGVHFVTERREMNIYIIEKIEDIN